MNPNVVVDHLDELIYLQNIVERVLRCGTGALSEDDFSNFTKYKEIENFTFNQHIYYNGSDYILNPNLNKRTHEIVFSDISILLDGKETIALRDFIDCCIKEDFIPSFHCTSAKPYHMMFNRQDIILKLDKYFSDICSKLKNFPIQYKYYCLDSIASSDMQASTCLKT